MSADGSSPQQPFVPGGAYRGSPVPLSIPSYTMPHVSHDTIILAATHPTHQQSDPRDDGFFISDFYAFNYLLKGLGKSQTWLTKADPHRLVRAYGNYYHGNPYRSRKVVLSRELLDSHELTAVTIVPWYSRMVDRFLSEAKLASERALKEDRPLLLMVFCHGLQNFNLHLDHDDTAGLSIRALQAVLHPDIRVSLLTPACYSGGWAISKLNSTSLAGATASDEGYSWPGSASIGRFCGTVFASAVIKTLTDSASPLLKCVEPFPPALESREDRNDIVRIEEGMQQLQIATEPVVAEGPSAFSNAMRTPKFGPPMPEQPSDEQMASYNGFCHAIRATLRQKVSTNMMHQFTFSARQDAWGASWMALTGIPGGSQPEQPSVSLSYFEQRWNRLINLPYVGLPSTNDQDPRSELYRSTEGSRQVTGTAVGASNMSAKMTASLGHARTPSMGQGSGGPGGHGNAMVMAKLFLQTCPGDWLSLKNAPLGGKLGRFAKGETKEISDAEVFSVIRFRWEYGLLVDELVAALRLPAPGSIMCMLWDWLKWREDIARKIPTAESRYGEIWAALVTAEFALDPDRELNQGPEFMRPMKYLTAAIVEADLDRDKSMKKVAEAVESINRVKHFYADIMIKECKPLRHRGRTWARSLGRKVRSSLSPRKKSVSDVSREPYS